MADALHQAAVTQEHIGEVIDDDAFGALLGPVEFGGQQFLGQRHAHRIGQALPQRPGGGLDTRRHADLGVPGGLAVQLAEALQLLDGQCVPGEMQQRVDQHRAVTVGQHETVAVGPGRIAGMVAQMPVPQGLGDLGHAHGRAGMA